MSLLEILSSVYLSPFYSCFLVDLLGDISSNSRLRNMYALADHRTTPSYKDPHDWVNFQ